MTSQSNHPARVVDEALPALPERPWARSADEVLACLGTSAERGLTADEARRRLAAWGANELQRSRGIGALQILLDQLRGPIVWLLVAAAATAVVSGEHLEAVAIAVVIVLNTLIGFFTERGARNSMAALRELGRSESVVKRDGARSSVASESLVPGDLVVVEAGDVIAADLRLVVASGIEVDESLLSGESLAVAKEVEAVAVDAPLSDRTCMLHRGSAVTRGAGEAVVVATGMKTQVGAIADLVRGAAPEATPLEKRLARLTRRLIGFTAVIAVLVVVAMITTGRDVYFAVEMAIALAVASIPEGLPIVATIALARGMWRMAKRNALIERLSAVETLGSASLLMADKTGTLTENRMRVAELWLPDVRLRCQEGEGAGSVWIAEDGASGSAAHASALQEALRVGVLCNNASLELDATGRARSTGDPTEVALLFAGAQEGLLRDELLRELPEMRRFAFDAATKRMSSLHRRGDQLLLLMKGAPEGVLSSCTLVRTGEGRSELTDEARQEWRTRLDEMAGGGERVLALATATPSPHEATAHDWQVEPRDLVFLGLVGLVDPPRTSAAGAIARCRAAGIRVVMVTGDHAATAGAIASALGLLQAPAARMGAGSGTRSDAGAAPTQAPAVVDASELGSLATLSADKLDRLLGAAVVARAAPSQKLELMELYQQRGEVVAMTGDGVNDAPALSKADIGIAMGRGTQVAREASAMVLRDDELGSVVAAVEQGRTIFENIRKFVVYLLTCNVSEILAVGLGVVFAGPLPILPLQVLFLNLVTDVFPALALGVCRGGDDLMKKPPRSSREPLLTRRHWREIFVLGAVMAILVLGAMGVSLFGYGATASEATTTAFLTLALAQLMQVFAMRSGGSSWWDNEITRNLWVWAAVLLCVLLLLLGVYWLPMARALSLTDPGWRGWGLALGTGLLHLLLAQVWRRWSHRPR